MKKILILQMRPEDETCDSEFEAIVNVGEIPKEQVDRIRVEQPDIRRLTSTTMLGSSPEVVLLISLVQIIKRLQCKNKWSLFLIICLIR